MDEVGAAAVDRGAAPGDPRARPSEALGEMQRPRRRVTREQADPALRRRRRSPARGHTVLTPMSKLPQTDELPHADEGFDPARVEEAFATFADRVRELESVAVRASRRAALAAGRADRSRPLRGRGLARRGRLAGGGPPSADWVASRAAAARSRRHRAAARARRRIPAAGRAPRRPRRPRRRLDRARDGRRVGARRPRGVGRGRQALPLAPRRGRAGRRRAGTGRRRQHRAVGHAGRRVDGDRLAGADLRVEDDRDEAARRAGREAAEPAPETRPRREEQRGVCAGARSRPRQPPPIPGRRRSTGSGSAEPRAASAPATFCW